MLVEALQGDGVSPDGERGVPWLGHHRKHNLGARAAPNFRRFAVAHPSSLHLAHAVRLAWASPRTSDATARHGVQVTVRMCFVELICPIAPQAMRWCSVSYQWTRRIWGSIRTSRGDALCTNVAGVPNLFISPSNLQ